MGKILDFAISYDTEQIVFYPGHSISGHVKLSLQAPMDMCGLQVTFKGQASCHWKEMYDETKVFHEYTNKELILKETKCVFGSLDGDSEQISTQPTGKHSYPFSFVLPIDIPSSFEGKFGHIRYIIKANVVRPWKFDHKVKRPVIINEIIDTNLIQYAAGIGGEKNKEIGCSCGTMGGPLDMTAFVDRSCYCPGESILINANVMNLTSKNMNYLQTKLVQTVTYHTKTKNKIDEKTIAKLQGPSVDKGEYAAWTKQPFEIPATSPTITSSNVLMVGYKLIILVGVPYGKDPLIELPIVIGTVPHLPSYRKSIIEYDDPNHNQYLSASNELIPPPSPSIFGYPDMAPPSYSSVVGEDCVSIRGEHDEYTYGELQYNPVYTFAKPFDNENESTIL